MVPSDFVGHFYVLMYFIVQSDDDDDDDNNNNNNNSHSYKVRHTSVSAH